MKSITSEEAKPKSNMLIPLSVVGLIVIATIGANVYKSISVKTTTNQTETIHANYNDGSYTAIGNYVSPGGSREIDLTIVIEDNKIANSIFIGNATDPTSKKFQGEFANNYKTIVVGKHIDDIKLTKVAGSSLTPKGFQYALEKIKLQI